MSRVVDQRKNESLSYEKKLMVWPVVGCGGQHDACLNSVNFATRMRQNSLSDEPPANWVRYRQKALDEMKKPVEV